MQELHLVGFTTDLEALIFSTRKGAKSGSYVVSLDAEVIAKIEEALKLRSGGEGTGLARRGRSLTAMAAPRQESSLSPKQMQAKLRSGRSISEVAREAGVDDEWVARFAAPIVAEQIQIVGEARERLMTKPRLGNSSQALDTAVRWNLGDRGIYLDDDEYEGGWGARNLRDTLWLVSFTYESRKREQRAEWELEHTSTKLMPKNRLASELGYVEPGRRRGPIPPRPSPVLTTRVVTQLPAAPADDDAPVAKLTPAQRKAVAKKVAAEKAAAKKAAAKQAAADREAARKLAKRLAVQRAAAKRAAAKQAAAAKKTAARLAAAKKAAEERAVKEAAARVRAAKKAAADKEKAKKAAARKAAAKKAIPRKKKAAAKKAALRKVAPRKTAKKAATRKTAAKKTAARKTVKKVPARRPAPKKAAAKRPAKRPTKSPLARKIPHGPKKVAKRKAAPKKVAARKTATRNATVKRGAAARRAAPRVAPVVRQAPTPAVLRPAATGEVGKSAAAAYLEARRRGPGEPVRPAAIATTPTPRPAAQMPASGGAPPVVIRAAHASAGPVEPEPLTDVSGNGVEAEETVGRSRLRRRRPLRGRS